MHRKVDIEEDNERTFYDRNIMNKNNTLEWSEASVQQQRNISLRRSIRNENIGTQEKYYIPCSKKKASISIQKNKDVVSESIRRGRAALAEAEEHIKMFEEYLSSSSSKEKKKKLKNVDLNPSRSKIHDENIPSSSLSTEHTCERESLTDNCQSSPHDLRNEKPFQLGSANLIESIIQEERNRHKRDELIATGYSQNGLKLVPGHDGINLLINRKQNEGNLDVNRKNMKGRLRNKIEFDPNNLEAARRCMLKAAKAAENKAKADAEAIRQTNFKARPLPGGIWVENDPYALTRSARGKVHASPVQETEDVNAVESVIMDDIVASKLNANRMDASAFLNNLNGKRPIQEHCTRKSRRKRQDLDDGDCTMKVYDNVTRAAMTAFLSNDESDGSLSDDQDVITIQQQIAKLKAELKFKEKKCFEVIDALEDERRKEPSHDDTVDPLFANTSLSTLEPTEEDHGDDVSMCNDKQCLSPTKPSINIDTQENIPLYQRHQIWLQNIEKKRIKAKQEKDKEAWADFTGMPNLNNACESWMKAKAEHDGLSDAAYAKEKMLKESKAMKSKLLLQKQAEEVKKLNEQVQKRNEKVKKGINKKNQDNYVDKLSRPNNKSTFPKTVDRKDSKSKAESTSNNDTTSINKVEIETVNESQDDVEKSVMETSFADMGDKEFARMVKKLGIKARIKYKSQTDLPEENLQVDKNGINIETDMLPSGQNDVKMEDITPKIANLNTKKSNKNSQYFLSSSAQEKLAREMDGSDQYAVATAKSTVEIESHGQIDSNTSTSDEYPMMNSQYIDETSNDKEEPYQRYEAGHTQFFDRSSSADRGRMRVRDARDFAPETMHRLPAPFQDSNGVMFLVGKKNNDDSKGEVNDDQIITILFDRSKYSENAASEWWYCHRDRIIP